MVWLKVLYNGPGKYIFRHVFNAILKAHDKVNLCVTVPFPHPTTNSILIGLQLICFRSLFPSHIPPLRFPGNTTAMDCHGRKTACTGFATTQSERFRFLSIFGHFRYFCDVIYLQSSIQIMCSFSTWFVSSVIVSLLDYPSCCEAVTGNSWNLNFLL